MDTQMFEALHIAIILHVSAIFYSHQYWMQTHLFVWAMCGNFDWFIPESVYGYVCIDLSQWIS
jgi:hypothetical protein